MNKLDFFKRFSKRFRGVVDGSRQTVVEMQKSGFSSKYIVVGLVIFGLTLVFGFLGSGLGAAGLSEEEAQITVKDIIEAERTGSEADLTEVEPAVKSFTDSSAIADPSVIDYGATAGTAEVEDPDEVPNLTAMAAVVREVNAVSPILNNSPETHWPLASLTKLMTSLVAMEELGPGETIKVSAEAVATEGRSGGFIAGEEFTVRDLVKAMMVASSNDASAIIQEGYDGKIAATLEGRINNEEGSAFIKAMTAKASEVGLADTFFADSSGLSSLNQSTLADIEKLTRYIFGRYKEILDFSTYQNVSITDQVSGMKRNLRNINSLAGRSDFSGGKTGYTDDAGENLISLFQDGDRSWLIVVLGSENRFGETLRLLRWAKRQ